MTDDDEVSRNKKQIAARKGIMRHLSCHMSVRRWNAERQAVNPAERAERKLQLKDKKRREEMERLEKERQTEIRSYRGLMVLEKMTSNEQIASMSKSLKELEDYYM